MIKSNKVYDTLKKISLFFVPISAFIGSVINVFGVPYADKITAVLTAVDTCLGAIIIRAKKQYDEEMRGAEDE